MKLIFAGTPEFASVAMQALVAAGHEIVLVLTQPDRPAGRGMKLQAEEMLAVCVQHELDHLLGMVFVEYLSKLKFNRIKTKMLKIKREDEKDAEYDKLSRPKM